MKMDNFDELCVMTDPTGLSPLSVAIGSNCPLDITERILSHRSAAVLNADEFGMVPLHLGCLNGANIASIELLLNHEHGKEAAQSLDHRNYAPLHYALHYFCSYIPSDESGSADSGEFTRVSTAWHYLYDDLYVNSVLANSTKVIDALCRKAPNVVFKANAEDHTPLDIVQQKKLKVTNERNYEFLEDIYHILKKHGIQNFKERKKMWENDGFETELNRCIDKEEVVSDGTDTQSLSCTKESDTTSSIHQY